LVFAVSRSASAAKLPCGGLRLNASKSESMLERDDVYLLHIYTIEYRSALCTSGIITGEGRLAAEKAVKQSRESQFQILKKINPLQTT